MKTKRVLQMVQGVVVAYGIALSGVGFGADAKTLIEMDGGKPAPALAKSWTKVKDGEYEFVLDTSKEVKKGTPVSPALVKQSLEAKLGSTYGVKVTEKGAGAVSVAYTGDEQKFLEQVGKAKIRAGKDVELALESSVSEGGIRAAPKDREAGANEVKAIVLSQAGGVIQVKVNQSKFGGIKTGSVVKVKGELKDRKTNELMFFKPSKQESGAWVPVEGSLL